MCLPPLNVSTVGSRRFYSSGMDSNFWDETALSGAIKCEGNLNFSTVASEDDEFGFHKKKLSRDPLSHRIIEKRRRDRMNNCLADLSRLLPSEYMKKGRGRIEKTEIIEMAIKHMKHLQSHPCTEGSCCPVSMQQHAQQQTQTQQQQMQQQNEDVKGVPIVAEHYKLGFHECLSETMHFLVEVEGFFAGDTLCVQLINHLQRHCDNIIKGTGFLRLGAGDVSQQNASSTGGSQHQQLHQQHLGMAEWSSPSGRWSPLMNGQAGGTRSRSSTATAPTTTTNDVMMMMMMSSTKEEPMSDSRGGEGGSDSSPPPPQNSLQPPQQPHHHHLLMVNGHPHHGGSSSSHYQSQQHPHPDTSGSESGSNHTSNSHNELSPGSQHSEKTDSQTHHHLHHLDHTNEPPSSCTGNPRVTYKFKNNIRKRFAHQREEEEHQNFRSQGSMALAIERRNSSTSSGHHPDTTTASTTAPTNSGISVPIFALSTRGSYYIPLSIDYSLLASHLDYYNGGGGGGDTPVSEDSDHSGGAGGGIHPTPNSTSSTSSSSTSPPGLVLHPVTISVNFRPPRLQARDRDYYHLVDNT